MGAGLARRTPDLDVVDVYGVGRPLAAFVAGVAVDRDVEDAERLFVGRRGKAQLGRLRQVSNECIAMEVEAWEYSGGLRRGWRIGVGSCASPGTAAFTVFTGEAGPSEFPDPAPPAAWSSSEPAFLDWASTASGLVGELAATLHDRGERIVHAVRALAVRGDLRREFLRQEGRLVGEFAAGDLPGHDAQRRGRGPQGFGVGFAHEGEVAVQQHEPVRGRKGDALRQAGGLRGRKGSAAVPTTACVDGQSAGAPGQEGAGPAD